MPTNAPAVSSPADPEEAAGSASAISLPSAAADIVAITGRLVFDTMPLQAVTIALLDANNNPAASAVTDDVGAFSLPVEKGQPVWVAFPATVEFLGGEVSLSIASPVFLKPAADTRLMDILYNSLRYLISGSVHYALAASGSATHSERCSDVPIRLIQNGVEIGSTATDEAGSFEFKTEATGLLALHFEPITAAGTLLEPARAVMSVFLDPNNPAPMVVPDALYRPVQARSSVTRPTTRTGTSPAASAAPGSGIPAAAPLTAAEDEPHIIEWRVKDAAGLPAANIRIRVSNPATREEMEGRTDQNGFISFVVSSIGTYQVATYPDAGAEPFMDLIAVHSVVSGGTTIPPSGPSGGSGGGGFRKDLRRAARAVQDAVSYPLLTEEVGYPPSPLARTGGSGKGSLSGGSVGQTATKAISDVLGWQLKEDPKAFVGALNASFATTTTEGRTEVTWTPRTYAVQTDVGGGVSGAQLSVYSRAKDALDKSLPLLDGLYSLNQEASEKDMVALRATVRSQLTDLVNEFGVLGGPRISRVAQFFLFLIGQRLPTDPNVALSFPIIADPDQLSGSLGNLRDEFGFSTSGDLVNTVEDEQNVTNFRIIADYTTSLAQSWLNNLQFFGLTATKPFFGTQLVLLSRQLSVVAESVNEVRFTLDSVFIGPAERQTLQLQFNSGDPDMFLEDLLSWIESFASDEGPRLIQDGGKFAVGESFLPIAIQLQSLAAGTQNLANEHALPHGFKTARVRRSLQELADQLQQLVSLATPIRHAITPEPIPGLTVLAVTPLTGSLSNPPPNLLIAGTGFVQTATVFLAQAGQTFSSSPVFMSTNLLAVNFTKLLSVSKLVPGPIDVSVTQGTGPARQTQTLVDGFMVTP